MRVNRWSVSLPEDYPIMFDANRLYHTRYVLSLLGCLLGMLLTGCAVTRPPLVYEDGVTYGATRGIWRDRWWNYYEAGIDYARVEKGLELSADCFREAITRRYRDQYRARTYGIHFIEEYFPHRELGIALHRLGDFQGAIRELQMSRSQTDSARARHYLNKAMGRRLTALDLDVARPTISFVSPQTAQSTSRFSVEVSGTVRDDRGVLSLNVNGKPQDVPIAPLEVRFAEQIGLSAGPNVIHIEAEDLTGKKARASVTVIADWDGPVIAINRPLSGEVISSQTVLVRGTVADDTGISSLRVNGIDVPVEGVPGTKERAFVHAVTLQPGPNRITVASVDSVGNRTTSHISVVFGEGSSVARSPGRIQLATIADHLPAHYVSARSATGVENLFSPIAAVAAGQEREPVRIMLADAREYQSTFYDWTRVSGTATSTEPLRSVEINGKPLVTASLNISHVSFSSKVPLKLGENDITVEAADVAGRLAKKTVRVERREPELAGIRYRMAMAMPKCIKIGPVDPTLAELAYTLLDQAFVSGGRFNMPARGTDLEPVLDELALSATIFVDPETVQRKGHLVGADTVLLVSITEWNDQFSILTRLVNTETGTLMAEDTMSDVFAEGKSIEILRAKTQILADRYAVAFPLLKGKVVDLRGHDIVTNVGSEAGLKELMKFHVYRELDSIVDPETGEALCTDADVLTQAFIHDVYERGSRAEVLKKEIVDQIAIGDSIITK